MPVNISSTEAGELEDRLKQLIEDAEEVYETRFRIAKEHYKNYNSIRSKRFYVGRADVFVPFSYIVVETLVAKIMKIIYSEPVLVSLVGIGPSDRDREERIRALYHTQQKKIVKLWPKLADYWRSKCIYGRAYAEIDWRTEYRTVKKTKITDLKGNAVDNLTAFQTPSPEEQELQEEGLDELAPAVDQIEAEERGEGYVKPEPIKEGGIPDDKRVKVETKEERVATYDCWDWTNLDFFDVLVDPLAPDADIQRAKWAAHRCYIEDDDLEKWGNTLNAEGKPIFEMWEDSIDAGESALDEDFIDRKHLIGLNISAIKEFKGEKKRHELHKIFLDYKFEGDDYISKNAIFYLLDRKKLIRAEKNPWWHGRKNIVSGAYTRRPNEFLGQGALDPVRKIQYEINDKRNQELDAASFTMSPIWLVGDDAELEDENIRISQQTAIRVQDVNAIKPLVFPDMSPVGQRAEAILEENLRETTGVTRSIQGISDPGRQTAQEFNQLINQASERIFFVLEAFGQEEWPNAWEIIHSLNQQFLKEDTFVRLTEREMRTLPGFGESKDGKVSPADIAMDVDFTTPSFQDIQLQNSRNQQIVPFMEMVSKMPPSEGNFTFFNLFMEKFWVDIMKFPREDLVDDKGNRILMSPPGFSSIYDADIQSDADIQKQQQQLELQQQQQMAQIQQQQAAQQQQQQNQAQPQEGGQGLNISDEDIAALAEGIL